MKAKKLEKFAWNDSKEMFEKITWKPGIGKSNMLEMIAEKK